MSFISRKLHFATPPPALLAKGVNLAKVKHFVTQAAATLVATVSGLCSKRNEAKQLFPYILSLLSPKATFYF